MMTDGAVSNVMKLIDKHINFTLQLCTVESRASLRVAVLTATASVTDDQGGGSWVSKLVKDAAS